MLAFCQSQGMAWRIHDNVICGEIDNRVKGIVSGRIWIQGEAEPRQIELKGNACPDLAGSLLKFRNPGKSYALPAEKQLHPLQSGTVGDLTASRKVRVTDVPIAEFAAWPKGAPPPPEHMANCLYLEWFSETNGRVVIEAVDWELEISAPEWQLTAAENEQRAQDAASGMAAFMHRLNAAIERHQRGQKDPGDEWDEHDYERFLRECDARTEKYGELLDKYGHSDEAEEKIAQEMGWRRAGEERQEEDIDWLSSEEIDRILAGELDEPEPDPAREGIDWIRTENGQIRHPLQYRCLESSIKFWRIAKEHGLEESENSSLQDFVFEFQTTGVKLGGALTGIAEERGCCDAAFTVAYLKRALDHLHKAQAGLESVAKEKLLPEAIVLEARRELFEIREGILHLMAEYRQK